MKHSDTTTPNAGSPPSRGAAAAAHLQSKLRRRPRWATASRRVGPVTLHELLWLALALVFNLVWELAQLGFYDLSALHTSVAYSVVHCTLGDCIITAVAYLMVVGVTRSRPWPYTKPWMGVAIMLVSTVGYTALSEWRNVYRVHSWAYAASMPLIAGIGASPLLQWIVVPVAILTPCAVSSRSALTRTGNPGRIGYRAYPWFRHVHLHRNAA